MAGLDGGKYPNIATDATTLRVNPLLESWTTLKKDEKKNPILEFTKYKGLIIRLRTKTDKDGTLRKVVSIDGSIHKYRNNGLHNYDDFTCADAIEVINELINDFEIDPHHTPIANLEFGVNVILDFPVKLVLDNLIHYKNSPFVKVVEDGMNYYQCKLSHFIIKIYDKGLQYHLPDNVLRFEIKAMKMQYFKGFNIPIVWLSDLLNPDIYPRLAEVLTTTFDGILFNDNRINVKRLTDKEQVIYYKGSNPKEWEKKPTTEREKKERQRFRNEFVNLLERERNGIDFRKVVLEKIRSKSFELSLSYQKIETVSNLTETAEKMRVVPFLPRVYSIRKGHLENATLRTSSPDNDKPKIKLCSGCGKPLNEGQKSYHGEDCRIRKIERNERSNPRNNERNGFIKYYQKLIRQPSLFELTDLIKMTPQRNEWVRNSRN